jgi:hypothetical protein
MAVAAKRADIDQELRCDIFIVMIDSSVIVRPAGPGLVEQPRVDCIAADEVGKRGGVSIKEG